MTRVGEEGESRRRRGVKVKVFHHAGFSGGSSSIHTLLIPVVSPFYVEQLCWVYPVRSSHSLKPSLVAEASQMAEDAFPHLNQRLYE